MAVVGKATCRVAGFRAMVRGGKVYEDDDPIVQARPDLFEDPEAYQRRKARPQSTAELGQRSMSARRRRPPAEATETARSAPGEKRDLDYPCPEQGCDERFTSERAAKAHAKKAHG